MAKIMIFQHVSYEPLGTLDSLIRAKRHRIRYINFGRDPLAEPDLKGYDGLIVLGGPMNIGDDANYPHLQTEQQLIRDAMKRDIPILGICLGAQLIAAANGAAVYKSTADEIGWCPVSCTEEGRTDPLIQHFHDEESIFQWHSYTFDLPKNAESLLSGDICRYQAFRCQEKIYALQFHLEVNSDLINRWLKLPAHQPLLGESAEQVASRVSSIQTQTSNKLARSTALSEKVFNQFSDLLPRVKGRHIFHTR